MPFGRCWIGRRVLFGLAAVLALGAVSARATPYLVVDADSDQVLMQNEATAPWYPASLTKLMTVYVALDAVRNGKLTLDTPLIMSARGARMPPSKMGFRPGTQVTLDNALKMLMVKSPNDVAVMVAEGVSGSVEAFADDMNADAQRLGMHNPDHVSSARDMAIVARALLREFPDHADLFSIGAIQLGRQYIPNHNGLLGRYPGADGMKTGFTCPAGFNVVASANHGGRRLIVVVLGAPSARSRNQEAADLFDGGFASGGGSGSPESLPSGSGAPDPHANVCLHHNAAALAAAEDDSIAQQAEAAAGSAGRGMLPTPLAALFAPVAVHTQLTYERIRFDPVPVYIGPAPGWKGPALGARRTTTETAAAPGGPKTLSADNSSTAATTSEGDASGPIQTTPRSKRKPARHSEKSMAAHKPAKSVTGKLEKKDVSTN
jgi:D-alanyl-D-alanine carboxypeptidase